ncbi:MAG: hypothetical protein RMY64_15360 [Nostoc sp. DedQUE08]|uniref:hypothetical protein n=1 Tax=Nostoc sp. DedQUE08 TaxID=3075393 RepID=UPI002AD5AC10|nr:hypothetical protein [Nostoc sp. DedQUE08]MDZ8066976.1 hypothetical protein [Nostoc sp. DedQUE08]
MQIKLSFVGYAVSGVGLSMLMGFLCVASPVSQFLVWIIGMICICGLAVGFFNFAGLVVKGFGFNRKTFTIGLMPGVIFLFVFLTLVAAGVALGVR